MSQREEHSPIDDRATARGAPGGGHPASSAARASALETLVDELDGTAARLRSGELEPVEAAKLVERCAELAARVGSELDRAGREAEANPADGQEQLL